MNKQDRLVELQNTTMTRNEIAKEIGVSRSWVLKWRIRLKLPNKEKSWNGRIRHTKEIIVEYVNQSISINEVLIKLNLKASGGNYAYIKSRIIKFDIDTSHFKGQGWNKGNVSKERLKPSEYLIYDPNINRGTDKIKRWILRDDIKNHKCENCGFETWLNKKIPLELHHKNGKRYDNRIENLLLLCPNCHALTDNHAGKGKGCKNK